MMEDFSLIVVTEGNASIGIVLPPYGRVHHRHCRWPGAGYSLRDHSSKTEKKPATPVVICRASSSLSLRPRRGCQTPRVRPTISFLKLSFATVTTLLLQRDLPHMTILHDDCSRS